MLTLIKILCWMNRSDMRQGMFGPANSEAANAGPLELQQGQAPASTLASRKAASPAVQAAIAAATESKPVVSELVKPFVLYMQYLLIVSSMSIDWPVTVVYPLKALAWAWSSTSPETLNVECLLSKDSSVPVAVQKVWFYLLLPVGMLAAVLLLDSISVHLLARLRGTKSQAVRWRDRLVANSMVVLFFFFPSICRTTFSMFACIAIDDPAEPPHGAAAVGRFWAYDMSQTCFEGYHKSWTLALGVPLVVVCCVAIPVGIVLLTVCNRQQLYDPHFKQHYGFVYLSYKPSCSWWEAIITLQTITLVAISVFGFSLGPYYTALCMNGTLAVTGLLLAYMKPYAHSVVGLVSLQCIGSLLLTSYVALTLLPYGGSPGPGQVYAMVVGAVVLVVNVAFATSVMWKVVMLVDWSGAGAASAGFTAKAVACTSGLMQVVSRHCVGGKARARGAHPTSDAAAGIA